MKPIKPNVRRTPGCLHLYRATLPAVGPYGWGDTRAEAVARLRQNIEQNNREDGTLCCFAVETGAPQGDPCILKRGHRGGCYA